MFIYNIWTLFLIYRIFYSKLNWKLSSPGWVHTKNEIKLPENLIYVFIFDIKVWFSLVKSLILFIKYNNTNPPRLYTTHCCIKFIIFLCDITTHILNSMWEINIFSPPSRKLEKKFCIQHSFFFYTALGDIYYCSI